MKRVSFQGTAMTATQRARRAAQAPHPTTDWDGLRAQLNARQMVGPPCPLHLREFAQPDREAERFWRMAENMKRYGYTEISETGTPFVGCAFGYHMEQSA